MWKGCRDPSDRRVLRIASLRPGDKVHRGEHGGPDSIASNMNAGQRLASQYLATGVKMRERIVPAGRGRSGPGPRQAQREQRRSFGFQERDRRARFASAAAAPGVCRRRSVLAMVQRLIERAAHHAGRSDDDIEARQVRHLDQRGDSPPSAPIRRARAPWYSISLDALESGCRTCPSAAGCECRCASRRRANASAKKQVTTGAGARKV